MSPSPGLTGLLLTLWLASSLQPGASLALEPAPSIVAGTDRPWIARNGGQRGGGGLRPGGGGGGGMRWGDADGAGAGGAGGGSGRRGRAGNGSGRTGLENPGGALNRGATRPSGGWKNTLGTEDSHPPAPQRARPDREPLRRDGEGRGERSGDDHVIRRPVDRGRGAIINREGDRGLTIAGSRRVNVNSLTLFPGWARPGWQVARPWPTGWYGGWSAPPWGWWGPRAVTWGIGGLATAALISVAIQAAIDSQSPQIVVPNTPYQLLYGTVVPGAAATLSFAVIDGGSTYQLSADCRAGTLNGRTPASAAEAELLNAACQVAYGAP